MEVWKIIFLSKWVMAVGSMLTFKGVSINFEESYLASKASLKEYQCSITMQNCFGTFPWNFPNSIPIQVSLQKKNSDKNWLKLQVKNEAKRGRGLP